jgi:outer membrane lipoprotein SlyB
MKSHRYLTGGIAAFMVLTAMPASAQDLFVYPAGGQSDEQLADDRYECHVWAVQESRFDPSELGEIAPPTIVRVPIPENEAEGATEKGAIAGTIAGAVIGRKDNKARSAILGGVIGAIAGAAVEQQGERQAREEAEAEAQREADRLAQNKAELAVRRSNYRRAMTACLEGRGYTVR